VNRKKRKSRKTEVWIAPLVMRGAQLKKNRKGKSRSINEKDCMGTWIVSAHGKK
jgi:hypothetical protein